MAIDYYQDQIDTIFLPIESFVEECLDCIKWQSDPKNKKEVGFYTTGCASLTKPRLHERKQKILDDDIQTYPINDEVLVARGPLFNTTDYLKLDQTYPDYKDFKFGCFDK